MVRFFEVFMGLAKGCKVVNNVFQLDLEELKIWGCPRIAVCRP
jgi:hypothetical protein